MLRIVQFDIYEKNKRLEKWIIKTLQNLSQPSIFSTTSNQEEEEVTTVSIKTKP